MRVAIAGAVRSSERVLAALLNSKLEVVAVFGQEPEDKKRVSGLVNLRPVAERGGVPYVPFTRINDHAARIRELDLDLLFVIGLSQLVHSDIIDAPRHGCVGFHPTRLPKRRGRAPLAWLVLEQAGGAATFFRIGDGMDDGPVYASSPFDVEETDDANDVSLKISESIDRALSEWLPRLETGDLSATVQDDSAASYRGLRGPDDGWIDWSADVESIVRLVRASARPHPGAFTYLRDTRVIIWKAHAERTLDARGVVGRIISMSDTGSFVVQCGQGLLHVDEYELDGEDALRVGVRLGYYGDSELFHLRRQVSELTERLERLENRIAGVQPRDS